RRGSTEEANGDGEKPVEVKNRLGTSESRDDEDMEVEDISVSVPATSGVVAKSSGWSNGRIGGKEQRSDLPMLLFAAS
ncbi:hypothetical protein LINPERHAP2_LOCUS39087, partial [Linum perenne]